MHNVQNKFPLGRIVGTPGALDALKEAGVLPAWALDRHVSGDWGDVCHEDRQANEEALREGLRLLSAYRLPETGVKLWVITEWDRSATTLLLPEEY